MLSIGIIGIPNIGKSTLFNALTAGGAAVSNYPFTTIDNNVGAVSVPDERLEELTRILKPEECTPSFIQFIDIAGLVKGASQGEGLGNQFLGHIRQVDALIHLFRCFQEGDGAHVFPGVDLARDLQVVEEELLLADLELLSRYTEKQRRLWQTNPRQSVREKERLEGYQKKLEAGIPLRDLGLDQQEQHELKALGLLTGKPVLYVFNVSEDEYPLMVRPYSQQLEQSRIWKSVHQSPPVAVVSAKIEWELGQLAVEDRLEFMQELGIAETGLERLVKKAYRLLDLITFYTITNRKLRAWEVTKGTRSPQAAGQVHSDMERGFIRAQVASFQALLQHGSWPRLHRLGKLRTEGKTYEIQDGDVMEFLFRS